MPDAERFFKLGMMCSTGQSVPLDMVSAHKWFNIAGAARDEGCCSPS
jgi:TPR repeat protein